MKQTEKPGFPLCWVYMLELRPMRYNSPESLRSSDRSRKEEPGKLLRGASLFWSLPRRPEAGWGPWSKAGAFGLWD